MELTAINVDSLNGLLPELEDEDKIDALNTMAFRLCHVYPDSAISLARQTIELSEKLGYRKGEATGYFNLGNGYFFLDSIRESVVNYLIAVRIFENVEACLEKGLTYDRLSLLNWRAGRLEKALEQEKELYYITDKIADQRFKIGAMYTVSQYYTLLHQFDSADRWLDQALNLLKMKPDTSQLSTIYLYKGYNANRNYAYLINNTEKDTLNKLIEKSIDWNLKYIELDKSFDFGDDFNPGIYNNIANAYLRLNTREDAKTALNYLYKAKHAVDTSVGRNWLTLLIYRKLGKLKADSGDYPAAIKIYMEGIKKAKEDREKQVINNPEVREPFYLSITRDYYYAEAINWMYYAVYDAFRKLGDYERALEYYVLKEKAKENIFLEDNKKLIAVLEAEYENEKIENQIAILEREKHVNELKARQTRNANIGIIIVFAVLVMMGILFLRQNKLKNDHKNALLEQKLLRLQMNPHFIFNALSNIHSLMTPKSVDKASAYLVNFSRLLRSSLESSREDYILLEDEISSLKNYLELQQLRYDSRFEYEIEIDPAIDLEGAILPPMLIQPFIENAIEHGIMHKKGPGRVFVRFTLNGKRITCEIEDDGVGREKAWEVEYAKKGKHKSLATEIIRDRIAVLNKKLKQKIRLSIIDLKPEAGGSTGTVVRLDLPYMLD